MAEYTNINTVTVAAGQNLPFTETAVAGNNCIVHREGAGVVTLRGVTNQCRARYKVSFGSNIAIPDGGTVEAISAAIAINGEPLTSSTAIITPAAVNEYSSVYRSAFVDVPQGCCLTIAVENTSSQSINFIDSNLMVERVA